MIRLVSENNYFVSESINIEADGYKYITDRTEGNEHYNIYRKIIRDESGNPRGKWLAVKMDVHTYEPIGEPFEITYDQALGYDPIVGPNFGRVVGKALGLRRESARLSESSEGFMIKTTTSNGSYYLIKSATRNKSFWNKSISYVNEFKSKNAAIRKLYTVLERLPENAFYDDEDMYDIEDKSDIQNARFAEFYITDTHGNVLEDISDKVKEYLLSSDAFMLGFDIYDEDDEDD